jgi:hypothetical protein
MALAIQDVDNYEPFRNIFSIIDNNTQSLSDGDVISLMTSLSQMRLDIKSIKGSCSCSGTKFCYNNVDAFISCSNLNYLLYKSEILYLLLPLHKRPSGKIKIQFTPNIKDIIIDHDFLDLYAECEEISEILRRLFIIMDKTIYMKIKIIFSIAIFDITCKYFILFKKHMSSPKDYYDQCILKLTEFANLKSKYINELSIILDIKGCVYNIFLKKFKKISMD